MQMNVAEAKAKLSELVAAAERGEEVVIARGGHPVVRMIPAVAQGPRFRFGVAAGAASPPRLDPPDPLGHQLVVDAVRTAVQRCPVGQRRALGCGQKQPVGTKVIEAHSLAAQSREQRGERARAQQLPWEQVVTLHVRLIAGRAAPVDRRERQLRANIRRLGGARRFDEPG